MPAILSIIVLLAALYFFWLFFRTATPYQMGRMLGAVALAVLVIGLVALAVTRRLPLALGVLIILWPIMAAYFDHHWKKSASPDKRVKDDLNDGYKTKVETLEEKTKNDFEENS